MLGSPQLIQSVKHLQAYDCMRPGVAVLLAMGAATASLGEGLWLSIALHRHACHQCCGATASLGSGSSSSRSRHPCRSPASHTSPAAGNSSASSQPTAASGSRCASCVVPQVEATAAAVVVAPNTTAGQHRQAARLATLLQNLQTQLHLGRLLQQQQQRHHHHLLLLRHYPIITSSSSNAIFTPECRSSTHGHDQQQSWASKDDP